MQVMIRALTIDGQQLGMPDEGPFDITAFALTGSNLGWGRRNHERLELSGTAETRGVGKLTFQIGSGRGQRAVFSISAAAFPLASLPALGGERFARYGARGNAELAIAFDWDDQALVGSVATTVVGLRFAPNPPQTALAQADKLLAKLGNRPVHWNLQIGGKPGAPEITDDGIDALVKGDLADAAKDILKQEAADQAEKLIDKHADKLLDQVGDKLPGGKDANEKNKQKAKDLLKGLRK